ncbi:MAG TPA: glycosyltransferase family 9 protein [Chthoniobacter sp.]|nr:glycosyltransferase family 9 protein [Chthoniobacter sp.]
MRILALQLKRIGDLVLTTPALRAIHLAWPEAKIVLGVMDNTAPLLPAIPFVQGGMVFGRGRGWNPWQQVLTGGWDMCFDFTGNDRSAFATALSRAKQRVGFEWVKRNRLRSLAYNTWSPSKVREVHTAQHYLDLVAAASPECSRDLLPELTLPESTPESEPYVLLHPGTAREDKYWLADRWNELAAHLHTAHGLKTIFTSGPDAFERAHVASIPNAQASGRAEIRYPKDLVELTTLVARARIVISCDTGVVHLASAFRVPQVVLYGPINPFHWRPLHDRAIVLSAAKPDGPLTEFTPRMKGASMDRISTGAVIRATDSLLALPRQPNT